VEEEEASSASIAARARSSAVEERVVVVVKVWCGGGVNVNAFVHCIITNALDAITVA